MCIYECVYVYLSIETGKVPKMEIESTQPNPFDVRARLPVGACLATAIRATGQPGMAPSAMVQNTHTRKPELPTPPFQKV